MVSAMYAEIYIMSASPRGQNGAASLALAHIKASITTRDDGPPGVTAGRVEGYISHQKNKNKTKQNKTKKQSCSKPKNQDE